MIKEKMEISDTLTLKDVSNQKRKIIDRNRHETYLLNNYYCNKLIKWLGREVEFEIIHQASTDGFAAKNFHVNCDFQGPTVVVAKNSNGKLIGGYSPLDWNGNNKTRFAYAKDESNTSFLFSLTLDMKFELIKNKYAICNSYFDGPKYGGGIDFEIFPWCDKDKNNYSNIGHSYEEHSISKEDFYGANLKHLIPEYEVYKIYDVGVNESKN